MPDPPAIDVADQPPRGWSQLWKSEDWWAVWIGFVILAVVCGVVLPSVTVDSGDAGATVKITNPFKAWVGQPTTWRHSPVEAFSNDAKPLAYRGAIGVFCLGLIAFGIGLSVMGTPFRRFAPAFLAVFILTVLAFVLAGQVWVKTHHLSYALWALLIGLIISNTIGTPAFLRPAVRTEFYIKTGLVLLGAEILFGLLLKLGVPGIFVAWVVTPVVLITTFWFGQRVLKIESKTLNITIAADMSVCGVSAAIATAAACRAKKEELTLAVGMSLAFTVVMMFVMPWFIKLVGMGQVLGGAWMGGTIDATGAVSAAGEFVGEDALKVAVAVKMIQNILIGVIAFCVAIYWVTRVERDAAGSRPSAWEIWHRFPKFVIGFVVASLVFSWLYAGYADENVARTVITGAIKKDTTSQLRGWFFCLAFVSIGLATNFRELGRYFAGGKPLILYLCGQSLNLVLTLFMAWLMFVKLFPGAMEELGR
jgi:uncharacterized integral membrane protein (TIGR00698 family)